MNNIPPGDKHRKQAVLLQYRYEAADLGEVFAYRPGPQAAQLAWELHKAYTKKFGEAKDGVQPPYRALEAILRAVIGDWARFHVTTESVELLAGCQVSAEDRLDVFTCWAEAILSDEEGRGTAERLAALIAAAEPDTNVTVPPPTRGRRSAGWWPGELARWRLAQHLAAEPWKLGGSQPVTFTLCTDGSLAALGQEIPSAPEMVKGKDGVKWPREQPLYPTRLLLPRIHIGTAATGHSERPALAITATAPLLADRWFGVSTVLLANPDQKIAVAARTDGEPWERRLNVPAVAASRRLAALPRLSKRIPPYPEQLDPAAIQDSARGNGPWAIAPESKKTPRLGRGHGMEMFRRIEKHLEKHCTLYTNRSQCYIEVPKIALSQGEAATHLLGPIQPERLPAALDAAGIDKLMVVVLWSTQEVRARIQAELAEQWKLGKDFVARERQLHHAVDGRIGILFLKDSAGALSHGTETVEHRRKRLDDLLAEFRDQRYTIAALCETDWEPDKRYPDNKAKRAAEALDGKFPSQQALALLNVSTQYINGNTPPVRTKSAKGEPYSETYIEIQTEKRANQLAHSAEMSVRDLVRGLGVTDHRLGAAFGSVPLEKWWHVGVYVRRHATRRTPSTKKRANQNDKPARLSVVVTAIRPCGGPDDPWTEWAYCPTTHRWQYYRTARLTNHAGESGIDVSNQATIADESPHAAAAAILVEQALQSAFSQLPHRDPIVVHVDGDACEYIWAGLTDENIGQEPPDGLPRDSSWLPGHSLPHPQRPLAVVRVINDLKRIGRPVGAKMYKSGEWKQTDVTSALFQLASDDGTGYLPDFLLISVPRVFLGGGAGRFANKETRYEPAAESKQGNNAYALTAVRYTVIATREDADTNLIGKAAAIMTNQAIAWDGRQTEPTPLRLARQIDTDHPYYRRTLPDEPDEEPPTDATAETN